MRKDSIGLMQCPDCDFSDAEIRETKAKLSYRYCPDCNAQYFTRNAEQDQRLRARMRPAAASPAPAPAMPLDKEQGPFIKGPKSEPVKPAPARAKFGLDQL